MFTTGSPVDIRFIKCAAPIVDDVSECRRVEWIDDSTLTGSRIGTLRGYNDDGGDDIRRAIVRVTLKSGWEHEVPLIDLMNAAYRHGYASR